MVPPTITAEMTQKVKSSVRSLIQDDTLFEEYYPEVVLSYATGRREQDCPGAGPGMYHAAGLVRILHECGLQSFSGLHVPVGVDWKVFMLRLKGRHANAKVLIVLKTKALYESEPCLKELNCAIERKIPLIPIVFEEGLPGPKKQWSKLTDQNSEIMIANVQEHLGKINDIPNPGTLLTAPSTLDEIIKEINKRVTIKARAPANSIEKETMLPKILKIDDHVIETFQKLVIFPEPKPAVAPAAPDPTLGQRYAIGSCVFVKRSNEQETLAYVNAYDAEEAFYTVDIETPGLGMTEKCHEKDLREANGIEGLIGSVLSGRASFFASKPDYSQPASHSHHA